MKARPSVDVFVLTYNRAALLRETLKSFSQQTDNDFTVTVLDNGSTDGTAAVVAEFNELNIRYVPSKENVPVITNFNLAQNLSKAEWTLVFHDDDLVHPDYVRVVRGVISSDPSIGLVGSAMSFESNPTLCWQVLGSKSYWKGNETQFAALLYGGFPFHFGSAVYKTEILKSISPNDGQFGKLWDRPFLYAAAERVNVAVFIDPYIKYRCHPGQDSQQATLSDHCINLHRKYYSILGQNIFERCGRVFLMNNYRLLCDEQPRLADSKTMPMSKYVKAALEREATTLPAIVSGKLLNIMRLIKQNL